MLHQWGAWFASVEQSQLSTWVRAAALRQQSGDCGGAARRCNGNRMNSAQFEPRCPNFCVSEDGKGTFLIQFFESFRTVPLHRATSVGRTVSVPPASYANTSGLTPPSARDPRRPPRVRWHLRDDRTGYNRHTHRPNGRLGASAAPKRPQILWISCTSELFSFTRRGHSHRLRRCALLDIC